MHTATKLTIVNCWKCNGKGRFNIESERFRPAIWRACNECGGDKKLAKFTRTETEYHRISKTKKKKAART